MKVSVLREQHEAPEWAQRLLVLAGGLNRFGKPNYRWVWGASRLSWIGGMWTDWTPGGSVLRQVFEMRHIPKYEPLNRWHLEKWLPPELYGSPRMWAMTTIETHGSHSLPALGPYPQFGEYEHSLTLDEPCHLCIRAKNPGKCEHRGFVQLTPEIAFRMARAIEFQRKFSDGERGAALEAARQRDAMQDDNAIDEMLGADPVQIPKARQEYLDRVIAPRLRWQAAVNKRSGNRFTGYRITADTPKVTVIHK